MKASEFWCLLMLLALVILGWHALAPASLCWLSGWQMVGGVAVAVVLMLITGMVGLAEENEAKAKAKAKGVVSP